MELIHYPVSWKPCALRQVYRVTTQTIQERGHVQQPYIRLVSQNKKSWTELDTVPLKVLGNIKEHLMTCWRIFQIFLSLELQHPRNLSVKKIKIVILWKLVAVVVATAHSRDVFSISIQEINIWIFSNLALNLSQSVI